MKRIAIHELLKLLLALLLIIGGRQCYADTVSIPLRYYHSDHLGSASWITNKTGTPVQHLQYMPYGELLVNEKTTSYEERFTFTGKERDSETGYSYFGARYYDSDVLTGWIFNGFNSIDRANYRAKCERVNQAIQDAGQQSINK